MIVTFCGHASFCERDEYEEQLLKLFEERIGDQRADFYLGGYGGFDGFAYDCCKIYQKTHPNVNLIFITPYMSLEYQKNHLTEAKKLYDDVVYPEIEKAPPQFAISYRNKWMVERADCVIAYITHDWGGAYQTYRHAKRKKKEIINLSGEEF